MKHFITFLRFACQFFGFCLSNINDEDETIDQIEMLIDFFEKQSNPITEFDESTFEGIVEKIVVINQHELEFHLIGGLKFNEKIK